MQLPPPQQALPLVPAPPSATQAHWPPVQVLLQQSAATLQLALGGEQVQWFMVQLPLQQSELRMQPPSAAPQVPQIPPLQRVPAQQGAVGPQLVPASTHAAHLPIEHTPSQQEKPFTHGSVALRQPGSHALSLQARPVTQSALVRHTPPSS